MTDMNKLELNSSIEVELNTTPSAQTATFATLCNAFKNIAATINEVVYNATYLANEGFASSAVVGAAPTFSFNGDFIIGDPVCEYLNNIRYEIGSARCTEIKVTRQNEVLTCPVTITGIAISGGESNAPNAIAVTIALNGKPTLAAPST